MYVGSFHSTHTLTAVLICHKVLDISYLHDLKVLVCRIDSLKVVIAERHLQIINLDNFNVYINRQRILSANATPSFTLCCINVSPASATLDRH